MSLLEIINGAQDRIGLARSPAIFAATDQTTHLLLGLSNQGGREILRRGDWQRLKVERTFTTAAAEEQGNAIPDDFDHIVNDTVFNRTTVRKIAGPLSAQQWQAQKALPSQPIFPQFRIRGNALLMLPAPAAGETVAFEYISKFWVDTDDDGLGNSFSWTKDADTPLLDPELLILDLIWRYKHSRGFDYAEDFRSFEAMLEQLLGRDGGAPILNAAGGSGSATNDLPALRSTPGVIW